MLLVTAHEFGHFIAARRNGVEVEEFGIGFPPRAIAWRKVKGKWRLLKKSEWEKAPGEGTIISLNWLPIGGFCQMDGESAADKRKIIENLKNYPIDKFSMYRDGHMDS